MSNYKQQYYLQHKDQLRDYDKEYYKKNKEKLNEKNTCNCGSLVIKRNILQHTKTGKHNKLMKMKLLNEQSQKILNM